MNNKHTYLFFCAYSLYKMKYCTAGTVSSLFDKHMYLHDSTPVTPQCAALTAVQHNGNNEAHVTCT